MWQTSIYAPILKWLIEANAGESLEIAVPAKGWPRNSIRRAIQHHLGDDFKVRTSQRTRRIMYLQKTGKA